CGENDSFSSVISFISSTPTSETIVIIVDSHLEALIARRLHSYLISGGARIRKGPTAGSAPTELRRFRFGSVIHAHAPA
ncbi:hypothetical protein EVAR_82740_1, partial [Eumeta japonica]